MQSLLVRRHPLANPVAQLRRLAEAGAPEFDAALAARGIPEVTAGRIDVLQVNVGKLCNQTCAHCHVDAGPDRRESMTRATAEQAVEALRRFGIGTLDITGGAPELNPSFRWLVAQARSLGAHVMDRCNLTVLAIEGQRDLATFLAEHRVEVVASLPSFRAPGTDAQRGDGVFARSLDGLRRLNAVGYGRGEGLTLNLVHNPVGAFLPGSQASIERDYRRELGERHGIVFDHLYTITNMPISRFLEFLDHSGNTEAYLARLVGAFNPAAVGGLMCRSMISVAWDGALHDCDFNQMLGLPLAGGEPATLAELLARGPAARRVRTDRHCFGCTAGAGSSCGGATIP